MYQVYTISKTELEETRAQGKLLLDYLVGELELSINQMLLENCHRFILSPYHKKVSWSNPDITHCPLCHKEKTGNDEGFHRYTISRQDSDYILKKTGRRVEVIEIICLSCEQTFGLIIELSVNRDSTHYIVIHNEITGYLNPDYRIKRR